MGCSSRLFQLFPILTIAIILNREHGKIDSTSLKALKECLPTIDEKKGIMAYMKQAGDSEEKKKALYADLSDCEKYMYCMFDVEKAAEKYDCLMFRSQFRARFDELIESIRVVEKACNEVKNSERLRKLFALILTVVNQINTGGDSKGAAGFSLDALLKLNEVRKRSDSLELCLNIKQSHLSFLTIMAIGKSL